jgi:hypothetical protein
VQFGKGRSAAKIAVSVGVVAFVAYSIGRRAPASGPATSASARAETVSPTDRAGVPGTIAVAGATTFTATANDSLHAAIFDGSEAVLAPGTTLSIGPRIVTPLGTPAWNATLSGAARITIGGGPKGLAIGAAAGKAVMLNGTYDVSSTAHAFVVHTIAGGALLHKPTGFFSLAGRKVKPGLVGRAEDGRMMLTVVPYK